MDARIGIRELRDNLKSYLDEVERGSSIEITRSGRTIGMLVPPPRHDDDPVERLVAEGRLLPSRSGHASVRLPRRVLAAPGSPTSAEALDELRADRR